MKATDLVFLIDVDNTLLDNDRFIADLHAHTENRLGRDASDRYWAALATLTEELGYVDYLGAVQRLRASQDANRMNDPHLLQLARFMLEYPFADRLYPRALAVLQQLRQRAPTVIVSDGDAVFQPRKVQRSGLWDAVSGQVLIYVHKEHMLDAIATACPARRYVMIDDKLRILSAMKAVWGTRLTTVFVRQGHYAADTQAIAAFAPADICIERIQDLAGLDWPPATGDTP